MTSQLTVALRASVKLELDRKFADAKAALTSEELAQKAKAHRKAKLIRAFESEMQAEREMGCEIPCDSER